MKADTLRNKDYTGHVSNYKRNNRPEDMFLDRRHKTLKVNAHTKNKKNRYAKDGSKISRTMKRTTHYIKSSKETGY